MRYNKRYLPLLLLMVFVGGTTAAFESTWGTTLDGSGSLSWSEALDDNDPEFAFTAALWSRNLIPLGLDRSIDLSAQGSYTWTDDRPYLFDLDLLRAAGRFPGLLGPTSVVRATAGRFSFRDTTGHVLSHTADGLQARINYPGVRTRVAAGYTGLLLNPVSDIRMTPIDLTESGDDDEFFGPRRAFGLAEVSFPELIGRHTVTVASVGQFDLRDADDDAGESTYNSGYFTLALAGPLPGGIYYDLNGTLSLGTIDQDGDTTDTTAILASARLRYFREQWLSSRFSLGALYASGSGDSLGLDLDRFVALSRSTAGTVYTQPLENLIRGELSYSLRPIPRVQTGLTWRSYFTADPDDNLATFDVDPDSSGRWIGNEVTLNVGARILSDLGLAVTGGAFFPRTDGNGVFLSDRDPEYLVRVEVSSGF